MKILVVGDWHSKLHEEAVYRSLIKLGHEALRFSWHEYFRAGGSFKFLKDLVLRAQNKFRFGPQVHKLNRDLIKYVLEHKPEAIFFYRPTHLFPNTLKKIKAALPEIVVVGYNNDDPFSPNYKSYVWGLYFKSLKYYDMHLAYRFHNLAELTAAGARRVELLRSWYLPDINRPIELSKEDLEKYECDVVFIGHYEPDHRKEFLEAIVSRNWKFKLFGPGYDWDPIIKDSPTLKGQMPVNLVWNHEYNKALVGAKIALCFLSKLNRDTYTRRCFEIPASGTLMLSEFTADLSTLYVEGEEVDFFRNKEELLKKIDFYLSAPEKRTSVAEAGRKRVMDDGHDIDSRMKQVIGWILEIQGKK